MLTVKNNRLKNKLIGLVTMGFVFSLGIYSHISLAEVSQVETEAVPDITQAPLYPKAAADQGVEGYVLFKFDINEQGKAINLKVIEASPQGVFEQEAEKAINRWRFKPAVKNGKAVMQKNMQYKLAFSLPKE